MGLALHLSLYVFPTTPFSEKCHATHVHASYWGTDIRSGTSFADKNFAVKSVWSKNRIQIESKWAV